MKLKKLFTGTCLLGLAAIAYPSSAPVEFPPVQVIGSRIGGGEVICRGLDCAAVLQQLQQQERYAHEFSSFEASIGESLPVDHQKLCRDLKARRPSGCNLSNPPASPGISPNWQPNGCGTGRLSNLFLDAALEMAASRMYSGNLDAPYSGASFLSACNQHDTCYAVAGNKAICDDAFGTQMNQICQQQAADLSHCRAWANGYHAAVYLSDRSFSAHQTASKQRACAIWALDMRGNQCN